MEKKRSVALGIGIAFLLIVALLHTVAHVFFYGTGVSGIVPKGVSGFSIGDVGLAEDVEVEAQRLSWVSRIVILAEWVALIGLVVFAMVRTRLHESPVDPTHEIHIDHPAGLGRTDLDVLYDLLKKEKKISLPKIQKLFGVSEEIVEHWCKTLESGNLAEVHYPRLGEPELRVNS